MTQCVVSLSLADQFRYAESHPREIVCDSATNENSKTDFEKEYTNKLIRYSNYNTMS